MRELRSSEILFIVGHWAVPLAAFFGLFKPGGCEIGSDFFIFCTFFIAAAQVVDGGHRNHRGRASKFMGRLLGGVFVVFILTFAVIAFKAHGMT